MTAIASMVRYARRMRKAWPFAIIVGAAAVVVPRLLRRRRSAVATPPPLPPGRESASLDRQTADAVALATALVSSRGADAAVDQLACLERAADIVFGPGAVVGSAFVEAQREAFLQRYRTQLYDIRRACEQCGGSLVPATRYGEDVNDWLPVWNCVRCGAQLSR